MHRGIRFFVGGLAILVATGGEARSQYYYPFGYGYGGYGFGGWGAETPIGNIAQGMGNFAAGEGVYNEDTAIANSVNTNSVLRFNQYMYNSMLEARRRYNREHAARLKMDDAQYQARAKRIRENPTEADIASGDALNAILDQLTDPKLIHGSSLRLANAKVNPEAIRAIPFRDETDGITLSLDEMTDPKNWPLPLRADAFKTEREAYQKAVDDALEEDKGGSLKPETVARVRNAIAALYQKVNDTIPKTRQPDHLQAMNYLKSLAGMSRMLERPNVEAVLGELEKVKTTTLGNLVAFMHSYNLRFAPADTARQRAVYNDLMPLMIDARDKIVGKAGDATANASGNANTSGNANANVNTNDPPPPPTDHPTSLFHGLDATHLNPRADAPRP